MEVEDLSPIEPQLAKLPPEDRELVTDYLKRSNGDVLPAQFADPDDPLTARTFAEAIALEKTHREKMKVEQAKMNLLQKAKARPDQVRKVLDTAKTLGWKAALDKVRNRLETPTPLGYVAPVNYLTNDSDETSAGPPVGSGRPRP